MREPAVTREPLFDPSFVRALESLTLSGRRLPSGSAAGQWRSRASGSSVEFSDYRTYTAGDEFRRIDWNAYARLERLFVRLYRAEEDLTLTLLVDASASMDWGRPVRKVRLAAQLAGALAFVALQSSDRVNVMTCREAKIGERLTALRGVASARTAWHLLENFECSGNTDLNAALWSLAPSLRAAGLTVVLSDLFSPDGYQRGIDALIGRRQDVLIIQILAPDEIEPPADFVGEWRLLDTEPSQAPVEASISPGTLRAYRRLLETFRNETADFCRRRGISYLTLRSDANLSDVVLRTFRNVGVLA